MAIELTMPALSPTMEKGTLAKWLVGVGDRVSPGDLLAEIETDKATMELEAVDEGRVAELIVAAGTDDVPVGTLIARFDGEDAAAAGPPPVLPVKGTTPVAVEPPSPIPADAAPVSPGPLIVPAGGNATPLARRLAAASGIALDAIRGGGPGGQVTRADLRLPNRARTAPAPPAVAPAPALDVTPGGPTPAEAAPPPAVVPSETIKLSAMRRTIARRLTEAKQTVPHFYLTVRCRLDALLALRTELNAAIGARGVRISVNDMMMKALATALVEVPDANVQFGGDVLHRFGRVDLAMAVAIEGGLVTPVVRDVAALSLSALARQSQALALRARDGKLAPEEYQGGTASVSNLGMFGIDEIVPVINPPQALILGIGAAVEMPWKVDGAVALANIVALTASFDHRAIDGAAAAALMAALRRIVEQPRLLLV